MAKLIQNAIWIPEKDLYLASWNTHDFEVIRLDDGKEYFIDGGLSYRRAGGDLDLAVNGRVIDYSLTDEMPILTIHNKLLWGTRGKDGKSPLRYRPIRSFERDHLQAILDNCRCNEYVKHTINYWLIMKNELETQA